MTTTKYLLYSEDDNYGVQEWTSSKVHGLYNSEEEAVKASEEYDKNVGSYWRKDEWKIKKVNLTSRTAYCVSYTWYDTEFEEHVGTNLIYLHKENAEKYYKEIETKSSYKYQDLREVEVFVLTFREEGKLHLCFVPANEDDLILKDEFADVD